MMNSTMRTYLYEVQRSLADTEKHIRAFMAAASDEDSNMKYRAAARLLSKLVFAEINFLLTVMKDEDTDTKEE